MNNREKILECALALFAERGYDAVGIQEIVEAAGVTKPTLYYYFTSKNGLLLVLLQRYFGELETALRSAASYQGNLTLTLESIVRACFEYARQHPTFYRLQLSLQFAPPGSEPNRIVRRYLLDQHQVIEQVFIQAVQEYGSLRDRQTLYAAAFLGMINNTVGLYLNGYIELKDELATQTVHQFIYGILA